MAIWGLKSHWHGITWLRTRLHRCEYFNVHHNIIIIVLLCLTLQLIGYFVPQSPIESVQGTVYLVLWVNCRYLFVRGSHQLLSHNVVRESFRFVSIVCDVRYGDFASHSVCGAGVIPLPESPNGIVEPGYTVPIEVVQRLGTIPACTATAPGRPGSVHVKSINLLKQSAYAPILVQSDLLLLMRRYFY